MKEGKQKGRKEDNLKKEEKQKRVLKYTHRMIMPSNKHK